MKALKHVLAIIILVSTFAAPVIAGQFEDGLAAAKRGDYATALSLWRPLAEQGSAVAQYSLGVLFAKGGGVPQDYQEALKWYRLAAAQGSAQAQNNLGVAYTNAQVVAQDYQEALKWYRLAATQGYAQAQKNLGVMYEDGLGVAQDYQEALKWYRLAAEQGFAQPPRIRDVAQQAKQTEILPADYAKCRPNFNICKGKFIKFDGVIIHIGGDGGQGPVNKKLVRISTPMHGFDVEMIEEPDANLYGAKVLFSGYLTEDHMYNDDVSRGQIEAVLMTQTEVNAEKEKLCERGNGIQPSGPRNSAEVKRDIKGIFLGMSEAEFLGRRENGCGGLAAQFTNELDQNVVKKIDFSFSSGTPPAEVISQITEQFNMRPIKPDWSAEIKHASNPHDCARTYTTEIKSIYDLVTAFCYGGLIAKWQLDQNLSLNLTLNDPGGGTLPPEYLLVLSSEAIAKLETQTEQNRIKEHIKEQEMRARTINPRQRF